MGLNGSIKKKVLSTVVLYSYIGRWAFAYFSRRQTGAVQFNQGENDENYTINGVVTGDDG